MGIDDDRQGRDGFHLASLDGKPYICILSQAFLARKRSIDVQTFQAPTRSLLCGIFFFGDRLLEG